MRFSDEDCGRPGTGRRQTQRRPRSGARAGMGTNTRQVPVGKAEDLVSILLLHQAQLLEVCRLVIMRVPAAQPSLLAVVGPDKVAVRWAEMEDRAGDVAFCDDGAQQIRGSMTAVGQP